MLPEFPWVRDDVSLAWRDDTTIEVGDGHRRAIIDHVDRPIVSWLMSLTGARNLNDALAAAQATGLGEDRPRQLLRLVQHTGLLDDAACLPSLLRGAAPALRDRLGGDLAASRHVHGTPARAMAAIDLRLSATVAVHGDNPLADLVCLALTQAGVLSIVRELRLSSSSRRSRRVADERSCHVLCDSLHPDAAAEALALDVPHLAVASWGDRGVVGPMVLPGITGCLRCRDLHRADADSAWPRVAVQRRRPRTPPVHSALAHVVAAWSALQVIALIEAGIGTQESIPTAGAAMIFTLPGGAPRSESRPAHPLCGCLWPMQPEQRQVSDSISAR